ncbi:MAG: hypothetical protein AB7S38_13040 [Vulcanimicrobiota bacterium]
MKTRIYILALLIVSLFVGPAAQAQGRLGQLKSNRAEVVSPKPRPPGNTRLSGPGRKLLNRNLSGRTRVHYPVKPVKAPQQPSPGILRYSTKKPPTKVLTEMPTPPELRLPGPLGKPEVPQVETPVDPPTFAEDDFYQPDDEENEYYEEDSGQPASGIHISLPGVNVSIPLGPEANTTFQTKAAPGSTWLKVLGGDEWTESLVLDQTGPLQLQWETGAKATSISWILVADGQVFQGPVDENSFVLDPGEYVPDSTSSVIILRLDGPDGTSWSNPVVVTQGLN